MKRQLALLITTVVAMGAAVFAGGVVGWNDEDAILLVTLAAIAVTCEVFDFSPFPNSRVSLSIAPILAAATFSGLPGVAVVATCAVATDYALHRKPAFKAAFNLGALLLTGAAHAGVLEIFRGTHDSGDWLAMTGPVILGSCVAFAVNSALVALAISLQTGEAALATWLRFRFMLPHYVILGVIALFMAFAYDRWDLAGVALLLAPLAMAWLLVKQYIELASPARPRLGSS